MNERAVSGIRLGSGGGFCFISQKAKFNRPKPAFRFAKSEKTVRVDLDRVWVDSTCPRVDFSTNLVEFGLFWTGFKKYEIGHRISLVQEEKGIV